MVCPEHDFKLLIMGMFGFDCIGDKKRSKDSWKDNETINARVINMTPATTVAIAACLGTERYNFSISSLNRQG